MPFRKADWSPALIAGNLEARASSQKPPPVSAAGSAAGAKVLAARWTKGREGEQPSETSAAPWFVGNQSFSKLREASPEVFKDWGDRYSNSTNLGYEFRPPPPEPMDNRNGSSGMGEAMTVPPGEGKA